MKHIDVCKALLFLAIMILVAPVALNAGKKKEKAENSQTTAVSNKEVNWMSLDDVQVAMRKNPKKIWVDVYTGWCGWCKVMDKSTYSNPQVISYINEHFYAVKFDAESRDSFRFNGKMFGYIPERNVNSFAVEIMGDRLSYPTSVYIDERFQNIIPIPGYQDVPKMEMFLKYLGEDNYKTIQYPAWEKSFKPTWVSTSVPPVPPAH